VKSLLDLLSSYREVSLFVYGKTKTLQIAKFIGEVKDLGKVAVVATQRARNCEKRPLADIRPAG
jgi:hypothetical protein